MTIRSFILSITSVVTGAALLLLYVNAQKILGQGFETLESAHLRTVENTALSTLRTRAYSLKTYLALLENDEELSSGLLMNREGGAKVGLQKLIEKIGLDTKADWVDVVYRNEKSKHFLDSENILRRAFVGETNIRFIKDAKRRPVLIGYAPLKNYGHPIGAIILGFDLNHAIAQEIGSSTRTTVQFTPTETPSQYESTLELEDFKKGNLGIPIYVQSEFIADVNKRMQSDILLVSGLSLLLIMLLTQLGLEFGFLRKFRALVHSINDVASGLDQGIVRSAKEIPSRVQEISSLSLAFTKVTQSLNQFSSRIKSQTKREAYVEVAEQVAHDLKSPVAALDMILEASEVRSLPSRERTIILKCLDRIKEIIGVLNKKKYETRDSSSEEMQDEPFTVEMVSSSIESIVTEKKIRFKNLPSLSIEASLSSSAYGVFARIQRNEFNRMLSNLIDNAVQAMDKSPAIVTLKVVPSEESFCIEISDNGRGIPENKLNEVLERGVSYEKPEGTGLGLWNANRMVKAWNGSLTIESGVGTGTTLSIRLPRAEAPGWFAPELPVQAGRSLLVLDDDPSMFALWQQRFQKQVNQGMMNLFYFSTREELARWLDMGLTDQYWLLCDYELSPNSPRGLEIIEEMGLQKQAFLVTSHYENSEIQRKCESMGLRIIPKESCGFVPVRESFA